MRDEAIAAVSAAIWRQLGRRPRQIRLIPTLEEDLVYEVSLPGGPVIFKAAVPGREGTIALEAWACERVRRAGVPAPRILAVDTSRQIYPGAYLIQEKVRGIPLSRVGPAKRRQWESLWQAGRYLRLIHKIALDGFGWLDGAHYLREGRVKGRYRRWSDAALRPVPRRLAYLQEHRVLDRKAIRSIDQVIEQHRGVLRRSDRGRLLHGDFGASHIFVEPGRGKVTGIIDFGALEAGDPLWDIARFRVWRTQEDLRDLIAGYEPDRGQLDESTLKFPLYALLQAIGDAVWLHEKRQKTEPALRAIRASLASLKERRYRTPV